LGKETWQEYKMEEEVINLKETPSVVRRPYLSSITEAESIAEESIFSFLTYSQEKLSSTLGPKLLYETSPFSTATTNCSNSAASPMTSLEGLRKQVENCIQAMPEEVFKIRNLDTGEEIDLRDENKGKFIHQITQVLKLSAAKLHSVLQF
jgi:hypothetical protein